MTVLICTGSYKSTIRSIEACAVIHDELSKHSLDQDLVPLPLADGGEGSIEVLKGYLGGEIQTISAHSPTLDLIHARILAVDCQTVFVESAEVIGYSTIRQSDFSPLTLGSSGLGVIIKTLIRRGYKTIYITMGDSVIMDLGLGMLNELGVTFFSGSQKLKNPTLEKMAEITDFCCDDIVKLTRSIKIVGLGDTKDFLVGPYGQAHIYGKQKGLQNSSIQFVENSYKSFLSLIEEKLGKKIGSLPMATGSGGIGGALSAFLDSELIHFPEFLFSKTDIKEQIQNANIIITGEGFLDEQTIWGKIPSVVASNTKGHCIGLVGGFSQKGLEEIRTINRNFHVVTLETVHHRQNPVDTMRQSIPNLYRRIKEIKNA